MGDGIFVLMRGIGAAYGQEAEEILVRRQNLGAKADSRGGGRISGEGGISGGDRFSGGGGFSGVGGFSAGRCRNHKRRVQIFHLIRHLRLLPLTYSLLPLTSTRRPYVYYLLHLHYYLLPQLPPAFTHKKRPQPNRLQSF